MRYTVPALILCASSTSAFAPNAAAHRSTARASAESPADLDTSKAFSPWSNTHHEEVVAAKAEAWMATHKASRSAPRAPRSDPPVTAAEAFSAKSVVMSPSDVAAWKAEAWFKTLKASKKEKQLASHKAFFAELSFGAAAAASTDALFPGLGEPAAPKTTPARSLAE